GDPCPHCREPALELDFCAVCENEGHLPRDDWMPGMADACLTRCVRCAMLVHVDCTGEDWTGNPMCFTCRGG
ncbi:MAG TPA: hypothetical protein VNZ52_03010, partial [Candidatus Thermoplasmatota archaeon]|nr:hypothetical protein [Candidatus Thermoplasmatota archaeon]